MNNKKTTIMFLILAVGLLGSCSVKQRITGTWTDIEGNAWVFSANGKLSYENGGADDIREFSYVITDDGKLSIKQTDDNYYSSNFGLQVYNVSFSADGKTLILSEGTSFSGWRTAGPGWGNNQLTRSSKNNSKGNSNANILANIFGGKSALVGKWVLKEAEEEYGSSIELLKDGTGTLTTIFAFPITWTTEKGRLILMSEFFGGESIEFDYKISGSTLTLIEDDGNSTIFKKVRN